MNLMKQKVYPTLLCSRIFFSFVLVVLFSFIFFVFDAQAQTVNGKSSGPRQIVIPKKEPAFNYDAATKKAIENFLLKIYLELEDKKSAYPELAGLDPSVILESPNGLAMFQYEFVDRRIQSRNNVYAVSLTFSDQRIPAVIKEGLNQKLFEFPALGLRLELAFKVNVRWHRFRVEPVIEQAVRLLYAHQQKYLPLQLTVETDRLTYHLDENVLVKVTLKNVTKQYFQVKELNQQSLYCTMGKTFWGTNPHQAPKLPTIRMAEGDTLTRSFEIKGLDKPTEMTIECTYNMSHKGILPKSSTSVFVQE